MDNNLDDFLGSLDISLRPNGTEQTNVEPIPVDIHPTEVAEAAQEHLEEQPEVVSESVAEQPQPLPLSDDEVSNIVAQYDAPETGGAVQESHSVESSDSSYIRIHPGSSASIVASGVADLIVNAETQIAAISAIPLPEQQLAGMDLAYAPVDVDVQDLAEAIGATEPPRPRRTRRARRQDSAEIPENSPTLLVNQSTSRFSGADWYTEIQKQRVILAGLGGIGSWTAIQLGRMGLTNLVLYDSDIVEEANMSGQLYSRNDVGKKKVNALTDLLQKYTSTASIYALDERFTEYSDAGDIMICGFDNMEARQIFFNKWLEQVASKTHKEECLFIDGRLSMNDLQVICITGDNEYGINEYQNKYLFTDAEADATICSMKQTTYLAAMIGSVITNLFTNWVANSLNPVIPYDLPFLTEYDAQNMIFKTKN